MADFDQIYDEIQSLLNSFAEAIYESWEECLGNCNEGQASIINNYVYPAINEVGETIAEDWPWGPGADEYASAMYNAYDSDVMYSAFSDTINGPLAELDSIQSAAQATDIVTEILG